MAPKPSSPASAHSPLPRHPRSPVSDLLAKTLSAYLSPSAWNTYPPPSLADPTPRTPLLLVLADEVAVFSASSALLTLLPEPPAGTLYVGASLGQSRAPLIPLSPAPPGGWHLGGPEETSVAWMTDFPHGKQPLALISFFLPSGRVKTKWCFEGPNHFLFH